DDLGDALLDRRLERPAVALEPRRLLGDRRPLAPEGLGRGRRPLLHGALDLRVEPRAVLLERLPRLLERRPLLRHLRGFHGGRPPPPILRLRLRHPPRARGGL